ncbi:MAG: NAD-dependent epimerase/dehydratase family protein [Kiloniellales bacterium]
MTASDKAAPRPLVAVTGASGFVGRRLVADLVRAGYRVRAPIRRGPGPKADGIDYRETGPLEDCSELEPLLAGATALIHLAARVHRKDDGSPEIAAAFRRVNVELTQRFATAARAQGLARFLFVSSIGAAIAEGTQTGFDRPNDYQRSKLAGERALAEALAGSETDFVVARPPLVYGAEAPGSFGSLTKAVCLCLPLPLASLENLRSLVYVGNLSDALRHLLEHAQAAGRIVPVSDGNAVTPPELARNLARALGRPALLLPCPPALLSLAGQLARQEDRVSNLVQPLLVDDTVLHRELGWQPPYDLQSALAETATRLAEGAGKGVPRPEPS